MRWEFCTKMIFKRSGYAEWHSWATYRHQDYFKKLYMNYLLEGKREVEDPAENMNKHLIQLDLAIYDELQWQKIMQDVEKMKVLQEAGKNPDNKELQERAQLIGPTYTCQERLSHAIEIDKIKIYPNHNLVIEKTKRKNIVESREERSMNKQKNNEYAGNYASDWGAKEDQEFMADNPGIVNNDQTFYFALADCDGALEIFEDDEKREHLLGLSTLWRDIDP